MLSWRSQSVCKQCSKHDGGAFSKHLRECAEYKHMENERQKRKTAEIKARERKRRRNAQAGRFCKDCWLYPCFQGIDNFSTNFALKCQNWHPKDSKG